MTLKLLCNGGVDPIGVDRMGIRLTVETDGSQPIASYTLYIKEAHTGREVYSLSRGDSRCLTVWVPPEVLSPLTPYRWYIAARLKNGDTVRSEPAFLETGPEHWQGQWIGAASDDGSVLRFCRDFSLTEKVLQARLYICGLGYFTSRLNGQALSDSYFIPPVTDYTPRPALSPVSGHRVTYYTYDVTGLLQSGENTLTAQVADGYYRFSEKTDYEPQPDMSFGKPCLFYELHLRTDKGTRILCSDTQTQVQRLPTISRLFGGDQVDLTKEPSAPVPAQPVSPPQGRMVSPQCQSDRADRVISPVSQWETDGGTIYDFGINHTGGLELTLESGSTQEIHIRYAEVLNPDGSLNCETGAWHGEHNVTKEKKAIYQVSVFRLKQGENTLSPGFSWFCYRYVYIPSTVKVLSLRSVFIHMDLARTGSFTCSQPILNRLHETFVQTLYCNAHSGIITDCPHREKLPYTGDGGLVMRSACYALDALPLYYKWFRDLLDVQEPSGHIPNSAPYFGGGGGYAWGNAICTVTKLLFRFTGDTQIARQGYEAILRWLAYYDSKRDENYIIRSNSHTWMLGDWLAPEAVVSNVYYISTVCYLQAAGTALFLAKFIDKEHCRQWQALVNAIKSGINRVFFDESRCQYGNGVQGEDMLALAEEIVPDAYRQQLHEKVHRHYSQGTDFHLDTGIVLTPLLISYLTDHGLEDIAWRIMTSTTYPSYCSLMENDTTFSEHWSKKWPDYYFGEPGNSRLVKGGGELSHCHPMYGSVCAWLYERVAGLDLTQLYTGRVEFSPRFIRYLQHASASKRTAWGNVGISWSRTDSEFALMLTVPQGLTGHCRFPCPAPKLYCGATNQYYYPDKDGYFEFNFGGGTLFLTHKSQTEAKK